MIKGNTKIQLFNAKTGALEQEIEKHNMVTNAVTKLLNPPTRYMTCQNLGYYELLNANCPIKNNAMAGIMLWDDTIEENADVIMPPINVKEVGHAGGVYSGTFKYRGTLNSNETGNITNGKRFVWDFGTDRANGTIKCVSLTSLDGGNCGFAGATDDLSVNKLIASIPAFDSRGTESCLMGEIEKNKWVALKGSNKTVTINYYSSFNENAINLSSTYFSGYSFLETKTVTLANSQYGISYNNNYGTYIDNDLVLHVVSCPNYSSNRIVNYAKINVVTGELISEQQITLSAVDGYGNVSYYYNVTAFNNKIYAVLSKTGGGTSLIRFSISGDFEKILGTWTETYYVQSCGMIGDYFKLNTFLINSENDNMPWVLSKVSSSYSYSFVPLRTASNIFPNMLVTEYANSSYQYFVRFNPYLATVNNLSIPVVKTSAQTMKITYEITESTT